MTEFPANLIMIPICPNDDGGRWKGLNNHESRKTQENDGSLRFSHGTEFTKMKRRNVVMVAWVETTREISELN